MALSPTESCEGRIPSWREYCIWSKTTKFETIRPSRSTKWSMPSSSIALPVPSIPWTGPLWVPVSRHCAKTSSPCSTIEMTSRCRSGSAAKVSSK